MKKNRIYKEIKQNYPLDLSCYENLTAQIIAKHFYLSDFYAMAPQKIPDFFIISDWLSKLKQEWDFPVIKKEIDKQIMLINADKEN